MKNPKASVLVVEDDPAILGGLLDLFTFNGFAAEGAADGGEGLARALRGEFDLLVLDVMLPTTDGFSICREVRAHKPVQPIIMLTAKGSEEDVVAGFKAGADDYVSKPFSIRELMVRVEAVLRRAGKSRGRDRLRLGEAVFDGSTLSASRGDIQVELTRREMELIAYLHEHRERIVSKRELLAEVWQYGDADIETRTVDIHILKLRKKLATLLGEAWQIHTIRGEGYRLLPAGEE